MKDRSDRECKRLLAVAVSDRKKRDEAIAQAKGSDHLSHALSLNLLKKANDLATMLGVSTSAIMAELRSENATLKETIKSMAADSLEAEKKNDKRIAALRSTFDGYVADYKMATQEAERKMRRARDVTRRHRDIQRENSINQILVSQILEMSNDFYSMTPSSSNIERADRAEVQAEALREFKSNVMLMLPRNFTPAPLGADEVSVQAREQCDHALPRAPSLVDAADDVIFIQAAYDASNGTNNDAPGDTPDNAADDAADDAADTTAADGQSGEQALLGSNSPAAASEESEGVREAEI